MRAKLCVSGRINLFTATNEDFIACFEGQGCCWPSWDRQTRNLSNRKYEGIAERTRTR